ncbi:HNH endonuclease [Bacillus sp. BPN334]|uniref:HNH endonuclease n=1 Tax=Bacillus sp. BPN334 TaxID=2217815 RepID=UPI0011ECCAB5|nr:HNH endonuclease signature motif containing protein [Bacillus sp. BPN334]KAA0784665.1 hypothetical protein DN393_21805 [Bacillus sp. BPN334]
MVKYYYTHPNDDLQKIFEKSHDWEKTKTELKYVRSIIYQKLSELYGEYCYYCKMPLDAGSNPGDIEHIVYKGEGNYKEFSYHPLNLTLTCKRCNTAKGTKESLISNKQNIKYKYEDYPQNPSDYTIVHTHFDEYFEHLEINDHIFIEPKNNSQKGIKTIEICNLYRLDLALGRVKRMRNNYGMGGPAKELIMNGRRSNEEIKKELRKFFNEDTTEKFQALMNIGNNLINLQVVNALAKIEDVIIISIEENYLFFEQFMKCFNNINQYYELMRYINETSTLSKALNQVIAEEHVLQKGSSKIFLNSNGLGRLSELVCDRDLEVRNTVNEKVKKYLRDLELLDINLIIKIVNEKVNFLKIVNVISEILKSEQIKYLLPGLHNFDFRFIKQEINRFNDKLDQNPQLKLLSLLEWYYKNILTGIDRVKFFKNKAKIEFIINYLESK